MSMVVRTNMMAMNANSALNKNNASVAGNLQKLSSGFKINRAADDASGLAVSEKMKAQIKALDQANKNAQDGASLIKTAEGYMGEIHDMLNRIVELAEKSANGTFETKAGEDYDNAATDRQAIQDEVDQLTTEIDRIATTANFNQLKLLDGSLKAGYEVSGATSAVTGHDAIAKDATVSDEVYATLTDAEKAKVTSTTTYTVTGDDGIAAVTDGENQHAAYAKGATLTADQFNALTAEEKAAVTSTTTRTASEDIAKVDSAEAQTAVTGSALKLQIGETSASTDKLEVSIMSFKTKDLFADIDTVTTDNTSDAAKTAGFTDPGSAKTINVSNQDTASLAAEKVRDVINKVSAQRATLGAMENRLDYTMNNLDTASQNITDANSRIRDTDMAKTMMAYTQGNTLTQAAQAMLAQANQAPSQVLQLLQ